MNISAPCASIQAAVNKNDFRGGDTILVASGTYYSTGSSVLRVEQSVKVLGGWNITFTSQTGTSILDGQKARMPLSTGYSNNGNKQYYFERFEFTNGSNQNVGIEGGGTLTLQNCVVSNASVVGIDNSGRAVLKNVVVRNNGLYGAYRSTGILNSANMEIWNSAIVNNQGSQGGGILNFSTLYINNSTISGNLVGESTTGGGILHQGTILKISNSTITANSSIDGTAGGINATYGQGVVLQNTILSGNTAASAFECEGNIISNGYNLIGELAGCNYTPGPGDKTEVWLLKIGALGVDGGTTPTHLLYKGSPAIDAGNPAGCTDHLGNLLATDQRDQPRSQDGDGDGETRCDIGAYESAFPPHDFPPTVIWYVASTGNDLSSCQSPSTPCLTLAGAINKANHGDTIRVGIATIRSTSGSEVVNIPKSVILSGGWNNDFTAQTGVTTVDGSKLRRVLRFADSLHIQIDRFNLVNGKVTSGDGAGILAGKAMRLTLRFVTITNNISSRYGGGINIGPSSNLWIFASNIYSNTAVQRGGAVNADDYNSIVVRNSTLSKNHANEGGGFRMNSWNSLYIYDSTFFNNSSAADGGAIYGFQNAVIRIFDSLFDQNKSGLDGGAIRAYGYRNTSSDRCVFSRNQADRLGGAIKGDVAASNSAFIGNSAYYGGAIHGSATLVNVTMHSNQARSNGGAIAEPSYLGIHNSTIINNHANTQGGGIFLGSYNVGGIENSILYGNTSNYGPDCDGDLVSTGYNLIGSMSGCRISLVSSDRTNINPRLMPLYPLARFLTPIPGSPALDGGNPAGCTDGTNLLTTDQVGTGRPIDGNQDGNAVCDIGAIEANKATLYLPFIRK